MLSYGEMSTENERKFLVRNDTWRAEAGEGVDHCQGYLSTDPDRSVRVRTAGGKSTLTIKGKPVGGQRDEFEYRIPQEDAKQLLDRYCVRPLISKMRYTVKNDGRKFEVDEFRCENQGLVLAELEGHEGTSKLPDWLGEEVTGDPRYLNLNLMQHPYSEWRKGEK